MLRLGLLIVRDPFLMQSATCCLAPLWALLWVLVRDFSRAAGRASRNPASPSSSRCSTGPNMRGVRRFRVPAGSDDPQNTPISRENRYNIDFHAINTDLEASYSRRRACVAGRNDRRTALVSFGSGCGSGRRSGSAGPAVFAARGAGGIAPRSFACSRPGRRIRRGPERRHSPDALRRQMARQPG